MVKKTVEKITEVEIGGKVYPLRFGLDFIREMDKRHTLQGVYGNGLKSAVVYLEDRNPTILQDIILSATHTLNTVPSYDAIEEWLETQDLDQLAQGFLAQLKTAPFTKKTVAKVYADAGMTM